MNPLRKQCTEPLSLILRGNSVLHNRGKRKTTEKTESNVDLRLKTS